MHNSAIGMCSKQKSKGCSETVDQFQFLKGFATNKLTELQQAGMISLRCYMQIHNTVANNIIMLLY